MIKKSHPDPAMLFEEFLKFELPKILNLSTSKKEAMNATFYQFASFIRPLIKKAPTEATAFIDDFISCANKIKKYRAPHGSRTITKKELSNYRETGIMKHTFDIKK